MSHQLPFTLTTLGVAMLVLFCVSRLSYQTSGTRYRDESPRVSFSGRQINQLLDLRAAYGEYAQCTVPNNDSAHRGLHSYVAHGLSNWVHQDDVDQDR